MCTGVYVTVVPFTTAVPWAAVAMIETPLGAEPLNRQLARFRVVGVLSGTDIAQAVGAGTLTVNCTLRLPGPFALVAVKVAALEPGAVGVPEITPVAGSRFRPAGKLTALYDRITGLVATICIGMIGTPAARVAKVGLVTEGTVSELMRILIDAELPVPLEFVACSTTSKSPLFVGVPVIWPLLALTVKPSGKPMAA